MNAQRKIIVYIATSADGYIASQTAISNGSIADRAQSIMV